ncbi:MAG: GGDEF domain-containing protein, partial [Oscillospiraceae bacterium]|nr:GGDEF domain-containing protein [Oscillospiraceae bacterium]
MSEIKLENRADLDILTQTLNINAFTEKARDFFSEGNQCMLAAVDLDNFSRINHHYGQLFGDMLICGIAEKLKRLLNESDIIGRAGGDEFLLLFGGIKNQDEALSRLNALKSLFEKPFQTETEKDMLSISAGIGAALFPEHGNSFDEVYTNTELALTHSKQLGHGVCALFDETMKSADKSHLSPQSVIGSTIDSKAEKSFSQNFIEHIFNILYNSKDINEAIPAVLSYTGSKFGVSHAYIFELSENKESYHKIFEWSAEEEKV